MGKFLKKITKPTLSILSLLFFCVGFLYFLYQETGIFKEQIDIVKIGIYIGIMVTMAALNISFVSLKDIGDRLKKIMVKDNLTPEQQVKEYTNLAMVILSELGEAWEALDKEQMKRMQEKEAEKVRKKLEKKTKKKDEKEETKA